MADMKTLPFILLLLLAVDCGPSRLDTDAWDKARQQRQAEWDREQEARLFESQVRLVRLRRGEAAASKYRVCHVYPPKTKQDQVECRHLDEVVAGFSKVKQPNFEE